MDLSPRSQNVPTPGCAQQRIQSERVSIICVRNENRSLFDVSYRSWLTEEAKERIPIANQAMYERIWDESDYVIPPSENNAFFVMTNVVMTANQTRTTCPEDPTEIPDVICGYVNETSGQVNITEGVCGQGEVFNLIKSHGN